MNCRKKHLQEFDKILTKYSNFIRANILKFNVHQKGIDPDDIYQEVRIKIWRLICSEKIIKNHALYIKKIINSSTIDYIRKSRRDEGLIILEKRRKISERKNKYSNIEKNNENEKTFKEIIGIAIDSLIDTRKKTVKLYLLNLSLDEISIVCNWSRDKTRNLLYRGLTDLKKKLYNMGFEYEDK